MNGLEHVSNYACMEFYDERKSLYLETDASGIGLSTGLLK